MLPLEALSNASEPVVLVLLYQLFRRIDRVDNRISRVEDALIVPDGGDDDNE